MDSKSKKQEALLPPPDVAALCRAAARALQARMQAGELSTAELIKLISLQPKQEEAPPYPMGDWVLTLSQDA